MWEDVSEEDTPEGIDMSEVYPIKKTIKGWVQTANDYEYGPTPIIYIGESVPTRDARTECENLDDKLWRELELFPNGYTTYRAKITIEIFEEKRLEKKEDW